MGFFNKLFGKNNQEGKQLPFSVNLLTALEKQLCFSVQLTEEDGLLFKKITNQPIQLLDFENEYAPTESPLAICAGVSDDTANKMAIEHLEYFQKNGKYIFVSNLREVALTGVTNDPYQLMEYAGTNGINYDIETKDIIEKYKKWDSEFGIIPIGIGYDFCECIIKNRNIDFKKLAEEVYEFCPDVVDQGTETIEALENEMKQSGSIYLWWD